MSQEEFDIIEFLILNRAVIQDDVLKTLFQYNGPFPYFFKSQQDEFIEQSIKKILIEHYPQLTETIQNTDYKKYIGYIL